MGCNQSKGGTYTPSVTIDDSLTDAMFTHNWGEGMTNHRKVAKVVKEMKKRGLTCWFDDDRMKGDIRESMTKAIENTQCMIVFVTKTYHTKVNGSDSRDNCKYEFKYGMEKLGPEKMVPVVMEAEMRNTRDWSGILGGALISKLYVDLVDMELSEEKFQAGCDHLYKEVLVIIGKTVLQRKAESQVQLPNRIIESSESKLSAISVAQPVERKAEVKNSLVTHYPLPTHSLALSLSHSIKL